MPPLPLRREGRFRAPSQLTPARVNRRLHRMSLLVLVGVLWILPVVLANSEAKAKGRGNAGLALGLCLGWLGFVITVVLSPGNGIGSGPRRKCPHCAEPILYEAKVCHWCRNEVKPAPPPFKPTTRLPPPPK